MKYIANSSTNSDVLIATFLTAEENQEECLFVGEFPEDMHFLAVTKEKDKTKKIFLVGKCKNKLAKVWNTMLS